VGLDSQDARGDAQAFLKQFPIDYPSVFDQDASQAQSLGAGTAWPTTIYLDKNHKITYVHVGGYASLALLEQDTLAFRAASAGAMTDVQTHSLWDVTGRAVDGPLRGTQLHQLRDVQAFWFAVVAFLPHAQIVTSPTS
ncbi:MAG: DUF3179 domain-containing protein, partial [Actinobacteria bacterium]|nr:DUF3179 domain-containing protein [Actinomycetota bacterium]